MKNLRHCQSAVIATERNFKESLYLDLNSDVRQAVLDKKIKSGYEHFINFGKAECRSQANPKIYEIRKNKNNLLHKLLKKNYDKSFFDTRNKFNFLKPNIREKFNIVDTPNISSHNYDGNSIKLINTHKQGAILDCGAGYRSIYYPNVINFEIVDYSTTDVIGVGEKLPFRDNVFDAVISIAVLEHVKDPFQCAKEIARVLKPGGTLYCAVPFLQPFHGYPNHYFNMTKEGLKILFNNYLDIEKQEVIDAYLPIWTFCWIIDSWADGLSGKGRSEFLDMKLKDFYHMNPEKLLKKSFVRNLSEEKNFELAAGTVLFGEKPKSKPRDKK